MIISVKTISLNGVMFWGMGGGVWISTHEFCVDKHQSITLWIPYFLLSSMQLKYCLFHLSKKEKYYNLDNRTIQQSSKLEISYTLRLHATVFVPQDFISTGNLFKETFFFFLSGRWYNSHEPDSDMWIVMIPCIMILE